MTDPELPCLSAALLTYYSRDELPSDVIHRFSRIYPTAMETGTSWQPF